MPNQVLGLRIPRDNGLDLITWSGNYCYSPIRVASLDENKNAAIERLPWLTLKPLVQTASLFVRVKNGAHPAEVGALAPVFEKSATEHKLELKQKLFKCKSTIQIVTFNVRILNRIGQLLELTASAIDHKIICMQEHRYIHSKDIKHHDTSNGLTFVSAFTWKNSVNAMIGGAGMLLGPRALKSLKSIKKI